MKARETSNESFWVSVGEKKATPPAYQLCIPAI